ncbi:MAG: TIGR03668 family PPOX class F420-dependent oxidoreductase [Dehalococcoidia bacterium]|jgi:PPOX class probable F420-dependent enzyme|nr:TIGR03668 family PPOX class F420-dependent oxidoreductase [Dehalococcoidia bacterium]
MELPATVRRFVQEARVTRLATIGGDGTPHLVPATFALLEGRIYSVVDEKPKRTVQLQRLRNIEANTGVALTVDRYSEDWSELAWVMIRGVASVLDGGAEYERALDALRTKYLQYQTMALDGRPMVAVEPQRVNSWGLED